MAFKKKKKQSTGRVIDTSRGVLLLSSGIVVSLIILSYLANFGQGVAQGVLFLVGMALLWYSSHAMSHYLFARFFGAKVAYFYIGRSEMRKAGNPFFSVIFSKLLVTIGTKLENQKFSSLAKNKRALIMGSGAIVSTILAGFVLLFGIVTRFGIIALFLGAIFFFANLATEIVFGTKAGDLGKMKRELLRA